MIRRSEVLEKLLIHSALKLWKNGQNRMTGNQHFSCCTEYPNRVHSSPSPVCIPPFPCSVRNRNQILPGAVQSASISTVILTLRVSSSGTDGLHWHLHFHGVFKWYCQPPQAPSFWWHLQVVQSASIGTFISKVSSMWSSVTCHVV